MQAVCIGANFSKACLKNCDFTKSLLDNAYFENANLSNAIFNGCHLSENTSFSGALGIETAKNDGEFTIQFMVNIGRLNEKAAATYIGGQSEITLKNVQSFIADLEQALNLEPG
ncbi:MAG: pentapeptide repeat-containing protein [Cyanothece sp. SIO2G6]|nr:pentapeptide repeat-containing protein [Cyanothece sp. SIO2G6]